MNIEAGIATVAIDFGSEWIKMGIVKVRSSEWRRF
jgi:hypothetical protein